MAGLAHVLASTIVGYKPASHGIFSYVEERGKGKVEKWALMQEPASTTRWSIGRGTCMEVVRNQETRAGHSATVKMIMASQITGPTCPVVTRCQITQPYVCSSLLPHLLASLSNQLGGTAPPTAQEKPHPRLLNSTVYSLHLGDQGGEGYERT